MLVELTTREMVDAERQTWLRMAEMADLCACAADYLAQEDEAQGNRDFWLRSASDHREFAQRYREMASFPMTPYREQGNAC